MESINLAISGYRNISLLYIENNTEYLMLLFNKLQQYGVSKKSKFTLQEDRCIYTIRYT
jgi:hypothetical protein